MRITVGPSSEKVAYYQLKHLELEKAIPSGTSTAILSHMVMYLELDFRTLLFKVVSLAKTVGFNKCVFFSLAI